MAADNVLQPSAEKCKILFEGCHSDRTWQMTFTAHGRKSECNITKARRVIVLSSNSVLINLVGSQMLNSFLANPVHVLDFSLCLKRFIILDPDLLCFRITLTT